MSKEVEKKSEEELLAALVGSPKNGTPWRHYKTGNLYWIQCCAINEATQEPMVIYHQQNSGLLFVRPLREGYALVEHNGEMVPRFSKAR